MWDQLEPTTPHLTYLSLSLFLTLFALFTHLIRNTLHLSEPPIATLYGILLGPLVFNVFSPTSTPSHPAPTDNDNFTQELTRLILAIQCFAVGIQLPAHWFLERAHYLSIFSFLVPVMSYSWLIASLFAYLLFNIPWPTALIIGACLSPTDPVLAASVLSDDAHFSRHRVPKRIRNVLSAESACNDGASFPFLYVGLAIFETRSAGAAVKQWFLITVLYQCVLGLVLGFLIGRGANHLLRFSERRGYVSQSSLVAFYLLLAIFTAGVGSTLGSDDFLVAFGAGVGFAHDGWFGRKAEEVEGEVPFRHIVDLVLDSSMFVYFGSLIPWKQFIAYGEEHRILAEHIGLGKLFLFLGLILLFRRIPILLAMHFGKLIPEVKTYREALFCGHFGPMGVGALFLAIEARAQLETGTSLPLPRPELPVGPPFDDRAVAINLVWPVICFIVLGSTMVHGLSVLVISILGSLSRYEGERAPLLGRETDGLAGMIHDESDDEGR